MLWNRIIVAMQNQVFDILQVGEVDNTNIARHSAKLVVNREFRDHRRVLNVKFGKSGECLNIADEPVCDSQCVKSVAGFWRPEGIEARNDASLGKSALWNPVKIAMISIDEGDLTRKIDGARWSYLRDVEDVDNVSDACQTFRVVHKMPI